MHISIIMFTANLRVLMYKLRYNLLVDGEQKSVHVLVVNKETLQMLEKLVYVFVPPFPLK